MQRHVILAAVCCLASTAHAGTPTLAERFHQRYVSLRSVSCTFKDGSGLRGQLEAMRGGRYMVTLADRRIISDGKTVWNVTPDTKTVIVNAMQGNADDLSLERVFFTIMAVYRGSVTSAPNRNGTATLRLIPPAPDAVVGGVEQADVTIDRSMRVTAITVKDGSALTRWTITAMTLDPKLDASRFTYVPPKGWNVVDLR